MVQSGMVKTSLTKLSEENGRGGCCRYMLSPCLTHYSKSNTVHEFTSLVSRSVTLVFNERPRD